MQRDDERHVQSADQLEDVSAGAPSIDAVLVLQADNIVAVEVQELCCAFIRSGIVLIKFQSDALRIVVVTFGIVDGDSEETRIAVFHGDCSAQISRERRNAALSGKMVPNKRDACWQRK